MNADACMGCGAIPCDEHGPQCPVYLAQLRRDVAYERALGVPVWRQRLYAWRFTNWLMARPWWVYPLWKHGWMYHNIASSMRDGFRFPYWVWHTITFPHVHAPWEDDDDWEDAYPVIVDSLRAAAEGRVQPAKIPDNFGPED